MKCELVASVTFFKESKLLIRIPHRRDSQHIGGIGFFLQVIERDKEIICPRLAKGFEPWTELSLMEKSLWTVGLGTITICKSVFISPNES